MTAKCQRARSSAAPDCAVRRATDADAEATGRLLHDFNTEFGDPTPGAAAAAERVWTLLAAGEITVLLVGDDPHGAAVLRFRESLWQEARECYEGTAHILPDDDPRKRLRWLRRPVNDTLLLLVGTQQLTIRVDLQR